MSALLALLQKKKQYIDAGKRGKTAKIPDGRSRWRFFPSWRGEGQAFWHDFGQHFIKKPDGTMAAVYICTDKTFGKPCEVCDAIGQATKACTDDATMKLLADSGAAGRVLVNAFHLDGDKPGEVQILELPPTVFNELVGIATEWEEGGESIFDVTAGREVVINRSGAGKLTKYSAQVSAKNSVAVPGVEILKKLHDLDAYVQQESEERRARALNSVRSTAGLLTAPGTGFTPSVPAGLPLAAAGAATLMDDDEPAAPPPRRTAAPAADVEDVVERAAPKAAAPAAAVSESTGDADLDELLAGL